MLDAQKDSREGDVEKKETEDVSKGVKGVLKVTRMLFGNIEVGGDSGGSFLKMVKELNARKSGKGDDLKPKNISLVEEDRVESGFCPYDLKSD